MKILIAFLMGFSTYANMIVADRNMTCSVDDPTILRMTEYLIEKNLKAQALDFFNQRGIEVLEDSFDFEGSVTGDYYNYTMFSVNFSVLSKKGSLLTFGQSHPTSGYNPLRYAFDVYERKSTEVDNEGIPQSTITTCHLSVMDYDSYAYVYNSTHGDFFIGYMETYFDEQFEYQM